MLSSFRRDYDLLKRGITNPVFTYDKNKGNEPPPDVDQSEETMSYYAYERPEKPRTNKKFIRIYGHEL